MARASTSPTPSARRSPRLSAKKSPAAAAKAPAKATPSKKESKVADKKALTPTMKLAAGAAMMSIAALGYYVFLLQ